MTQTWSLGPGQGPGRDEAMGVKVNCGGKGAKIMWMEKAAVPQNAHINTTFTPSRTAPVDKTSVDLSRWATRGPGGDMVGRGEGDRGEWGGL